MAKRKINKDEAKNQPLADNVHIKGAGSVQDEVITNTLTDNFMPYAMSIILSRAIPQIDGFKPSHRKLLYTMYNMGLLQSGTIKSANIVGRTMQLNPHGDAAIYETMIRLSRGNETLLYPYVESKGNFGKAYSKNMPLLVIPRLSWRLFAMNFLTILSQTRSISLTTMITQ